MTTPRDPDRPDGTDGTDYPGSPDGPAIRTGSDLRAVVVLVAAVGIGGIGGYALTELVGAEETRWGGTEVSALASALGALAVGAAAGRLLLGGTGRAMRVRAPAPVTGWPGSRLGAGALVLAPLLLLAGEVVRSGHHYFFPAQLAAVAETPGPIFTSAALYTGGLVLMIPAVLALTGLIGRRRPGWAFWAATVAVVGCTVRIFEEGVGFLALRLVEVQGVDAATAAVSDTYGDWYVLRTLNGSDNLGWALLAIGAYRAGVLGWVPALGVAFMMTHYSGVVKGSDLNSLLGAVMLAAVFLPLGVGLWRRAEPVSRRVWWGGVASVALLAAQYLLTALSGFRNLG